VTLRKRRIVLGATTAIIAVVVALFAQALLSNRDNQRAAAKRRFADQAQVSSALISSLFNSTAAQAAQQATKSFGSANVDPKTLDAYAKKSRLSYVVVLDGRGRVIAHSSGADGSVISAIAERPRHVTAVLNGEPWQLSGITKGNNAEYALPFKDAAGGKRVVLQGFPVQLVSGFVSGTLAELPNAEKQRALVVDGDSHVISSASADRAPGSQAPTPNGDRVQTGANIDHSQWKVVLSQRKADLYKGVGSAINWLVLVALAGAGLLALVLLRRAMRQSGALLTAYAELETSSRDLERTNIELSRSNGELEQFASVASHDLQEPLRKVQTFGDQLERRYGEELPDEAKDYLRRMRSASARMSVLIEDLLRFSRVTTHAKPHVRVDLDRVARDVLQDLDARVADTGGRVEIEPLPAVQADPTQMRQLLQNLIANALKFHRDDVPPVVRVAAAPAGEPGMVAITVTDNGIGFESNYEERIFRVFERLHPRDVYAGTGIGLPLCRKIAERHRGTIRGEGRPGEGATFTVTLPLAASANGRAGGPVTATAPVHA
jgi:signal transduction histidine kinase